MTNRQVVGVIIALICMISPLVFFVGHTIYWLCKCWMEGGDWKYYAEELLVKIWIIAFATAAGLILL